MNLKATHAGELVAKRIPGPASGRVSRVFRNSAYLDFGDDVFLLLRGSVRSPMTVNVDTTTDFQDAIEANEACSIAEGHILIGETSVDLREAKTHSGRLRSLGAVFPVETEALVKGVMALRLLYDASASGPSILADRSFREFADSVLLAAAKGDPAPLLAAENYWPLVGTGVGFTPAGDDLVGGFVATMNCVARVEGANEISLPRRELDHRTVRESAALIDYAQRGYVDEEVEKLVLSLLEERPKQALQDMIQLARRGHTSGIDMSLGVVFAVATQRDSSHRDGTLGRCMVAAGIR